MYTLNMYNFLYLKDSSITLEKITAILLRNQSLVVRFRVSLEKDFIAC